MMRAFVLGTAVSLAMSPALMQPQDAMLRATSRLVQLNVLVHDAKGAPVRDLTKDDFVVLDEGRQRRVAIFRKSAERAKLGVAGDSHPSSLSNRSSAQTERPSAATILLVDFTQYAVD